MRTHVIGAVVVCLLGGVPLEAAAQFPCVKPWAIADKWIDNRDDTEPIDQIWTEDDTFEALDARGGLFPDADFYVPAAGGNASTGFSLADVGRRVWLKVVDGGTATRQSSFAVDIGGSGEGGDLILQDPLAYWDPILGRVVMSCAESETPCGPFSPRLAAIAAFDPVVFEQSFVGTGTPIVKVSNVIGVFIEAYIDGQVLAVIVPVAGQ
jgi:hypothetical protein